MNIIEKEITINKDSKRIYGVCYLPDTDKKCPLIIFSHGVGGAYTDNIEYAKMLAELGIAAFSFDFCGGGGHMSSGKTTEMSVMTEVEDMTIVLNEAMKWSFVDNKKIVLLGISQGGIVAAITAARNRDKVAGLILEFPAFVITDAMHNMFGDFKNVPKEYDLLGWIRIGYPYAADMWNYDVYSEIGKYDKKVLLLHGDADPVVPLPYSEKAARVYKDVDFHVIKGGGHGFWGEQFKQSLVYIFQYLRDIGILKKRL